MSKLPSRPPELCPVPLHPGQCILVPLEELTHVHMPVSIGQISLALMKRTLGTSSTYGSVEPVRMVALMPENSGQPRKKSEEHEQRDRRGKNSAASTNQLAVRKSTKQKQSPAGCSELSMSTVTINTASATKSRRTVATSIARMSTVSTGTASTSTASTNLRSG